MKKKLTLSEYIKRRNGIPFGAPGSLSNSLYRSFGSASFAGFWRVWNPIWGFYLGRYVFLPLKSHVPAAIALLLTFAISGALHDLAVMAVRWHYLFFFTPWFFLMGLTVVISNRLEINYRKLNWYGRASINLFLIAGNLAVVNFIQGYFA